MTKSKSLAGLLALVLAAIALAAWETRRRWTSPRQTALGTGDPESPPAAGSAAGPSEQASPETALASRAMTEPATIAEDEESALQPEIAPETAEELADLLPEPDLSLAGLGDDEAVTGDEATGASDAISRLAAGSVPAAAGATSAPDDEEGVDQVLAVLAADADQRDPSAIQGRFGPNAIPADQGGDCPPDHPVKGNANSMIYHLPGQSSYGVTMAEVCFTDADAAQEAGFRPRKR